MTAHLGPLGFGTASIGNLYREATPAQAQETLDAAWNSGFRYFDTAPHYGLGLAEQRLGEFLRRVPRDEVLVSTKVGRILEPNPDYAGELDDAHAFAVPNTLRRRYDFTPAGIRQSLEESLERLGLDRVDIVYLHDPDVYDLDLGISSALPELEKMRAEGLVTQIGVGINDSAAATRTVREADLDLVMIAGRYTLLEQPAAADLIPACEETGTRIVAAAPFNSGLLATNHPADTATYNYGEVPEPILRRAQQLAQQCAALGVDLPTAALQFPLRNPTVASVVVGTARADAITENAERMRTPISEDVWAALTEEAQS